MLYFLGGLILVCIIVILLFIRTSRDTKKQISYKDRAILEATFDNPQTDHKKFEPQVPKKVQPVIKFEYPKDFKSEILRFKNQQDPDNEEFNMVFKSAMEDLATGDYNGALNKMNNAVDLNQSNYKAIYCRGLLKCLLKNFEDAQNDFTETIQLEIDEKNALYFRGIAKYESDDLLGAEQDFNSFHIAAPEYIETNYYLGLICSKQERFDDAVTNFSKVINQDPKHGKAFFERGMVKFKEGNKEGCCKDLRASLTLGNLEAYHHIKEICEETPTQAG